MAFNALAAVNQHLTCMMVARFLETAWEVAMRNLLFAVCFGLMSATAAEASVPPEVMDAYKSYTSALEAGDRETAVASAKAAYEAAKSLMPENRQTGALAENYADIIQTSDVEEAVEAYRLALQLQPDDTTAEGYQRRIDLATKLAKTHMFRADANKKDMRNAEADAKTALKLIEASGQTGTTFHAEALVVQGWLDYYFGRKGSALERMEEATTIFDGPEHTVFSELEYHANLLKGQMLNYEDKPIEAALSLQKVMQNLEGDLPVEHPFIDKAFSSWLWSRSKIASAEKTDEALAAGVCKCWPYDEMSEDAPLPMMRVPPRMPSTAKRSGQVLFKFDIDENGKPKNIVPTAATETGFIKPATRAIESWQYEVLPHHTAEDRSGIATTISFRLTNERGQIIPERELQPIEPQ